MFMNRIPQSLEKITFCKTIYVQFERQFYNDNGAINFFIQNIKKKRFDLANIVYKVPKKEETIPLTTRIFSPSMEAPELHHFWTFNWGHWWAHISREYKLYKEKEIYKRNLQCGPDIACAHFVLRNGGRVKFYGQEWLEKVKYQRPFNFPDAPSPEFVVEAINLRGYPIEYDNFESISNLFQLKYLNVSGCSTVDDWMVDRIAMEFPGLEWLNISNCEKVTDRGLQALYKMPNLKTLIVTNFFNSAALSLTCYMLEDINPYLQCKIIIPEGNKLLEES